MVVSLSNQNLPHQARAGYHPLTQCCKPCRSILLLLSISFHCVTPALQFSRFVNLFWSRSSRPNKFTRLIQLCLVKVKAVFTYYRLVKARNKQRLHQLNFISSPLHFTTLRSVSRIFTPCLSHSHGST